MRVHILMKCCLGAAALATLAVIGVILVLQSLSLDQVRTALSDQVHTATGRTLDIAGPLQLQLLPVPVLVADTVTLSNPAGSIRPEMIKLERFELEVALLPLFRREIVVNRLLLVAPDIWIETEQDGPGNLDFRPPEQSQPQAAQAGQQPPPDSNAGMPLRLVVKELKITKGRITWHDRSTHASESIAITELKIYPEPASPELLSFHMTTTFKERSIEVNGHIGSPFAADRGTPWPVDLTVTTLGLQGRIHGSIAEVATHRGVNLALSAESAEIMEIFHLAGLYDHGLPQQMGPFRIQGHLKDVGSRLDLQDLSLEAGSQQLLTVKVQGAVNDLFGAASVDVAADLGSEHPAPVAQLAGIAYRGKGPLQINGRLQGSGAAWKVTGMQASADDNHLGGDIALQLGRRPKITGTLTSTNLNPVDFSAIPAAPAPHVVARDGDGQGTPTRKSDGRVFSDTPLPLDWLRLLDANLTVQAARVTFGHQQVQDAALTAALQNGRLQITPFQCSLAGGRITGGGTLDLTGEMPKVSFNLQGHRVEIGTLAPKGPISGGKSDFKVNLVASGNSVRALMASATGETTLSVGEGRLRNKTLDMAAGGLLVQVLDALNPFAKSENSSHLVCAAARFTVHGGLATADNGVAMRTKQVDVLGSGTVNLRTEGIDMAINPRARDVTGLSLTTPLAGLVKIQGTIAQPSVGIDSAGTLKTAATVGAGIATGGLSTLGGILLDKFTSEDDPCRTALGLAPAAKSSPKTERSPKKSGGLLQELFGK